MTDECYDLIEQLGQRLDAMEQRDCVDKWFVKDMRLIVELAQMHAQQWMGHVHAMPTLRLVETTLDNVEQRDRDIEEQYQDYVRREAEEQARA